MKTCKKVVGVLHRPLGTQDGEQINIHERTMNNDVKRRNKELG